MFIRNVYNLDQNYTFNPPSIHDHKDKKKNGKISPRHLLSEKLTKAHFRAAPRCMCCGSWSSGVLELMLLMLISPSLPLHSMIHNDMKYGKKIIALRTSLASISTLTLRWGVQRDHWEEREYLSHFSHLTYHIRVKNFLEWSSTINNGWFVRIVFIGLIMSLYWDHWTLTWWRVKILWWYC